MPEAHYDFVVVGAGSAGALLASRLSASGRYTVLLLEAGGQDRSPWIHIPLGYAKTILDTRVNWAYHTEPEPELHGRRIYWPRGKVLGGSAAINGLIHIRGQRADYDAWQSIGCTGWGWDDVLPYFKKLESHYLGESDLHGADGPVAVQKPLDRSELCETFIEAGRTWGLSRNEDFNGHSQEGIGYYDLTVRNGRRSNSAIGALRAAARRPNLTVVVRARALRVLLTSNTARGIEYALPDGEMRTAIAAREVLLCGGAINSPQLLMLSGIGSGDQLREHGIRVAVESAQVGENLQDHLLARLVCRTRKPITLNDELATFWGKTMIGLRYALQRRGPLTYAAAQAGFFVRSTPTAAQADTQGIFSPYSAPALGQAPHRFSAFSLAVTQSWPSSRGRITLRDADPLKPPIIRANYLSAHGDAQHLLIALRRARELLSQSPMRELVVDEHLPGRHIQEDAALMEYIRQTASTCFHPCGTCRMGNDEYAVVTPDLRVQGVNGLRVVDASIMPRITSGNINAPVLMIAEKAAELILGCHDSRPMNTTQREVEWFSSGAEL